MIARLAPWRIGYHLVVPGAGQPPLTLDILVVPRASRAAVGPLVGDRVRVAVTAPPVDGAANAAVIEALADAFGVRKSAVTILRGERGRRKTVQIAGAARASLDALLGRR